VCLAEWVVAAGWIAGSLLWLWRSAPPSNDKRRHRR
jgi:hypothetical protein